MSGKVRVRTETLVAGGGPAGLATAACLKRANLPFEIVERGPHLATAWRGHYDRLHLHTPKGTSALPFRIFDPGTTRYPSRDDVTAYLEAYAKELGLAPRLGEDIVRVRRDGLTWTTETSSAIYESKRVVVALGWNRVPFEPPIDGRARFKGTILHSSTYKTGADFRGKRVLVVGFGNSGAEIALDLVEHGAESAVSIRSGANVVPREFLMLPMQLHTILIDALPLFLKDFIARTVSRLSYGNLRKHGIAAPDVGILTQIAHKNRIPVLDVGTIREIKRGKIRVFGALERLVPEGAVFAGKTEPFDAIVLATGFRTGLKEIVETPLVDELGVPVTDPRKTGEQDIYFVGYTVAATGVLRRIAREARNVARDIERRRNGS